MAEKPTYEELEQRVIKLETEAEKRKQAEEALEFERLLLFSILDSIEGGIYVSDIDTYEILYASYSTKDAFQKEIIGGVCYKELQGFDSPCEFCTNDIILKKKPEPHRWEHHNPILDKDYAIVDRIIKWPDGRDVKFEIAIDITDRKQAEDNLKIFHEQLTVFRQFAEESNQGMGWADLEGRIVYINKALSRIFGVQKPEDVYGKPVQSTFYPESIEKRLTDVIFPTVLKEGKWQGESEIRTKHGKSLSTYENLFLINDKDGNPLYYANVLSDITERKQAEELIRNLSHQIIKSQESERQRISYELHDSVAQDLSSSRIICEMLLDDNSLTPEARNQISLISGSLRKTLENVRDLSYELRPPGLEELGLTVTIYNLCEEFSEKTSVKVDFQSAGIDNLKLSYNTKINLYRLLQEGLNNIKKHADACNVKVRLLSSFPNIILRIYDDGKGFDLKERLAKASGEKRMGLSSMEHRVDLLLGRIDIESIPGKGTKIVIEVPQKDVNIVA